MANSNKKLLSSISKIDLKNIAQRIDSFKSIKDFDSIDQLIEQLSNLIKEKKLSQDQLSTFLKTKFPHIIEGTLQGQALNKPFGYAGDFDIIDKIYTHHINPQPEKSLWDQYFQMTAAVEDIISSWPFYKPKHFTIQKSIVIHFLMMVLIICCSLSILQGQDLNIQGWSGGSGPDAFSAEHVLTVSNGNYLVTGSTENSISSEGCAILVDSNGNELVRRILPNINSAFHAVENNGSFYVVGNNDIEGRIYRLSLNALAIQNEVSFYYCPVGICLNQFIGSNGLLVSGSGIIVAGYAGFFMTDQANIKRYDANLNFDQNFNVTINTINANNLELWGKEVVDIERMSNGDILFLGHIEEDEDSQCNCSDGEVIIRDKDFWGLRISSSGSLVDIEAFGSRGDDRLIDATAIPGGGFTLIGNSCDIGNNFCDDNRPPPPFDFADFIWEFDGQFASQDSEILALNADVLLPYDATSVIYDNGYYVTGYLSEGIIQNLNFSFDIISNSSEGDRFNRCTINNDCLVAVGTGGFGPSPQSETQKIWVAYGDCEDSADCSWDRDIECGVTYTDNTLNWDNSFTSSDYSSCFPTATSFNGGDIVFRFNKPNSTGNLAVTMRHAAGEGNFNNNLSVFLLDACGSGEFSCLEKGINWLQSDELIRGEYILDSDPPLPAGEYFLVVDGGEASQEGPFSITVTCEDLACDSDDIECGETLSNQSNAFSANNVSHYGCPIAGDNNWSYEKQKL